MSNLRLMLNVIAGGIKNFDEVPPEQQYLFENNRKDIRAAAVDYVAKKIADGPKA